ncbi:MAG: TonB-dependent receptor plug domain-containing protein, partial [Bacteroidota bacterium]
IYAHSVLGSELKGHLEQPAYYFDEQQPLATKHLDVLLMSQGWRRFDWTKLLQDEYPAYQYPFEQSILLTGRVEKELNKKKAPGIVTMTVSLRPLHPVDSVKATPQLYQLPTSEDGHFLLNELYFQDTMNVFIQARSAKGATDFKILPDMFNQPTAHFASLEASQAPAAAYVKKMSEWAALDKSIQMAKGNILLQEVVVKSAKPIDTRTRLYSTPDVVINAAAMVSKPMNVFQFLYGVAGVNVQGGGGGQMSIFIRGSNAEPIYVLDGIVVDKSMVQALSANDIESVEVLKDGKAAVYGARGSNGAVIFFTKRGNPNYDYSQEIASGATTIKLAGYSKARAFYSPRYDVPDERHNLPDFRSTVHWQPNVRTNAQGMAEITFFTSDETTRMIATCEGTSGKGLLGVGSHAFEAGKKK